MIGKHLGGMKLAKWSWTLGSELGRMLRKNSWAGNRYINCEVLFDEIVGNDGERKIALEAGQQGRLAFLRDLHLSQ
jgi:hypothetical protein